MLLGTNVSIAIKNSRNYGVKSFSLFNCAELSENLSALQISLVNKTEVMIKVECEYCGGIHFYKYNLHDFIKKQLIVGGCEALGFPLFYVGKELKVRDTINKVNKIGDIARRII